MVSMESVGWFPGYSRLVFPQCLSPHTVKKSFGEFRCMWLMTLLHTARSDVKFSQIEGNDRKFCHIELSNNVICKMLYSVQPRGEED